MLKKSAIILMFSFLSANVSAITIDGITFDPGLAQFDTVNSLFATEINAIGDEVKGIGEVVLINGNTPGTRELTYVFDGYIVDSFDGLNFTASGGSVRFYSDINNYSGTLATASDGNLWLDMQANGLLIGTVTDGRAQGLASGLLDAIGGLALSNFDTDSESNGADMSFNASYSRLPTPTADGFTRVGSSDAHASPIPEPAPLALMLLGLGLVGASRVAKSKK